MLGPSKANWHRTERSFTSATRICTQLLLKFLSFTKILHTKVFLSTFPYVHLTTTMYFLSSTAFFYINFFSVSGCNNNQFHLVSLKHLSRNKCLQVSSKIFLAALICTILPHTLSEVAHYIYMLFCFFPYFPILHNCKQHPWFSGLLAYYYFVTAAKGWVYVSIELQPLTGPMSSPQTQACLIHLLTSPYVLLNLSIKILKMFCIYLQYSKIFIQQIPV